MSSYTQVYDAFIQDILTEDVADAAFQGVTTSMQVICGGLAACFFIVAIAWEYATHTIKGTGYFFRWGEISRLLILWFAIGLFPGLMAIPAVIADGLREQTAGLVNEDNIEDYAKYIRLRNNFDEAITNGDSVNTSYNRQEFKRDSDGKIVADENVNKSNTPNGSEVESDATTSSWTKALNFFSFSGGIGLVLSTAVYFICQVVKLCMVAFCICASKVMICLGPLSVVFSMLPFMKDKFSDWFGFYLALLFTPVTLNVIDAITLHFIYKNLAQSPLQSNLMATTAMDLTVIILYLYAFGLTAKYAGTKEAGQAFSQGVRTIMEVAQTRALTTLASKSTDGGGASMADNVANTGKEALRK